MFLRVRIDLNPPAAWSPLIVATEFAQLVAGVLELIFYRLELGVKVVFCCLDVERLRLVIDGFQIDRLAFFVRGHDIRIIPGAIGDGRAKVILVLDGFCSGRLVGLGWQWECLGFSLGVPVVLHPLRRHGAAASRLRAAFRVALPEDGCRCRSAVENRSLHRVTDRTGLVNRVALRIRFDGLVPRDWVDVGISALRGCDFHARGVLSVLLPLRFFVSLVLLPLRLLGLFVGFPLLRSLLLLSRLLIPPRSLIAIVLHLLAGSHRSRVTR